MKDFFDLREFLVFVLKKLKFIVIVTLLLSAAWALVRFVPLTIEYITYKEPTTEELAKATLTDENEPYRYRVSTSIYVEPIYTEVSNTVVDRARYVADMFTIYWRPENIVEIMQEEFFDEFVKADAVDKQNLVDYNYRTKAVMNERYLLQNFINSFTVERPSDTMVTIVCTGTDKELCERGLKRYKELMIANVQELSGGFTYVEQDISLTSWLPEATAGLVPKTASSVSGNNVVGVRPKLSQIAERSVKGAVWGAAAGIAVSIVIVFFISVISLAIQDEDDLKSFQLKLLGVYKEKKKKKLFRFVDVWIEKLQGRSQYSVQMPECCDIVRENILMNDSLQHPKLLLTSCGDFSRVEQFTQGLRESFEKAGVKCELEASPCVINHSQTIASSKNMDGVILVEQAGVSNKEGIRKELEEFSSIGKEVVGVVFLG